MLRCWNHVFGFCRSADRECSLPAAGVQYRVGSTLSVLCLPPESSTEWDLHFLAAPPTPRTRKHGGSTMAPSDASTEHLGHRGTGHSESVPGQDAIQISDVTALKFHQSSQQKCMHVQHTTLRSLPAGSQLSRGPPPRRSGHMGRKKRLPTRRSIQTQRRPEEWTSSPSGDRERHA